MPPASSSADGWTDDFDSDMTRKQGRRVDGPRGKGVGEDDEGGEEGARMDERTYVTRI
jgi:hypothetical protein